MATATEVLDQSRATESERWRPTTKGWAARIVVFAIIFGAVFWATANVPQFWADRIALAVIYAIIGLSLNIVLGYIGQVSLGHHAFVGISAFVAAYYVSEKAGCTPEGGCTFGAFAGGLLFATLAGAVTAGLLGLVALRIKGLYLALITLAYGFMAETSIFEIPFLTRSGAGMPAPRPDGFTTDRAFAFLCFAFLALVIYIDWRLIRSKVGRAILSVKHSEAVASSYGINVTAYKIIAFIISGLFAGLAGGLFAFQTTNVVSNLFTFSTALLWVLMVVIGGLGNRTGVIIGSAFFALFPFLIELWKGLEHWVVEDLERAPGFFSIVIGSLLAMLTIIQFPGGIAEQISPITRWLRGERFTMHPEGHHRRPKHKGLLSRFKHRTADEEPSETEEVVAAPVTSSELLGSDVGASSDGVDADQDPSATQEIKTEEGSKT